MYMCVCKLTVEAVPLLECDDIYGIKSHMCKIEAVQWIRFQEHFIYGMMYDRSKIMGRHLTSVGLAQARPNKHTHKLWYMQRSKISHELNYPYEQIYNMLVHVHTLYKYSTNYIIYTYNHAPIRTHVTVMWLTWGNTLSLVPVVQPHSLVLQGEW